MDVNIKSDTITVHNPVAIFLEDVGSAFVHAGLKIEGQEYIQINEPGKGSAGKEFRLAPGAHQASFSVAASKAFGPVYNTTLKINNSEIGSARGTLSTFGDGNFKNFTLYVV